MIGKTVKFRFINQELEGVVLDKYQGLTTVSTTIGYGNNLHKTDIKTAHDFYLIKSNNSVLHIKCDDIINVL